MIDQSQPGGNVVDLLPPRQWPAHYTEDDRQAIDIIYDALNAEGSAWTISSLARKSGVSVASLHMALHGQYAATPAHVLKKALDALEIKPANAPSTPRSEMPIVETTIYRMVVAACHRARVYRNFAVVSAFVGAGKTRAARRYAELNPGTIIIDAIPEMTSSVLLDHLVEATHATVYSARGYTKGTKAARMDAVLRTLRGQDVLLVLDEAETTTPGCLEYVRRLRDLAGIGVVLMGTEKLEPMVRDAAGRFGQISSRVGYWASANAIRPQDAHALTSRAFMGEGVELTTEVLDAFWQACDGSARVLCEGIIPGVRDYGLKKGLPLTPALVHEVTYKILGYHNRKRRGGAR